MKSLKYILLAMVCIAALLLVISVILCGYTIVHFSVGDISHNLWGDSEIFFVMILPVALLLVTIYFGEVYSANK